MTRSRIELHTIILAVMFTSAASIIGYQTLSEYQKVKKEKTQLTQKQNICYLVEMAPYASWFRNPNHECDWFNNAYQQQFDKKSAENFLQQLITTEDEILQTRKPVVQQITVTEGSGKGSYTVLTYPVFDDTRELVGVGGVAIKDAALKNGTLPTITGAIVVPQSNY